MIINFITDTTKLKIGKENNIFSLCSQICIVFLENHRQQEMLFSSILIYAFLASEKKAYCDVNIEHIHS